MDNLKYRGQNDQVGGLAPHKTLNIDCYRAANIPTDWDIVSPCGDIIMITYVDAADDDGEYIERDGILVQASVSRHVWRVGQIVKAGPHASEQAKEGAYVMFPNDKGVPMTGFGGKNYVFLNEERIFCYVQPKEDSDKKLV